MVDFNHAKAQLKALGYTDNDDIYLRLLTPKGFSAEKHGKYCPHLVFRSKDGKILPRSAKLRMQGNHLYQQFGDKEKIISKDAFQWLLEQSQQGFAVYVVVNPGGHEAKKITGSRVLFYEHDDLPKAEQLQRFKKYHKQWGGGFAVETNKSIHCYFKLNIFLEPDAAKIAQKRLIQLMGSDKSIWDSPRLMRLAGFDHTSIDDSGKIVRFPIKLIHEWDGNFADWGKIQADLPEYDPSYFQKKKAKASSTETVTCNWSEFLEREVYPRLRADQIYNWEGHNFQRESDGKLKGNCPWHDSQSGTAFWVTPSANNATFSAACPQCTGNEKINPIAYRYALKTGNPNAGQPKGQDFIEVVQTLAAEAGVSLPKKYKTSKQTQGKTSKALTYVSQHGEKLHPASTVADILTQKWRNLLVWNNCTSSFWEYGAMHSGLWTEVPEIFVRQKIQAVIRDTGIGHGAEYISGTLTLLRANLAVSNFQDSPGVLPLRNGVLDLATRELMSHSPSYQFTWQLPFEYDPQGTCEPIIEWLLFTQAGNEQRVQVLQAYLKAIVCGRTGLQRFLELIGPGGTGKSTFVNLAIALIGLENCHVTDLQRLEKNRFETANIFGKRLVYITDSERYAGEVSVFKALTGQDPLPYERKYKQAETSFLPTAMVVLAANEPVSSADYTSGLQRRRLTIPFLCAVQPNQRRNLLTVSRDGVSGEFAPLLPGLLNWILALPDSEMVQLVVDTDNTVPTLANYHKENLIATNSLAEWLDACCVWAPGVRTQIGTATKRRITETKDEDMSRISKAFDGYEYEDQWLYPNYCQFCDRAGLRAISIRRFGDLLLDLCGSQLHQSGIRKSRDRNGAYFEGITLRNDDYANFPRPITGENKISTSLAPEPFPHLAQVHRASAEKLLRLLQQARDASERKSIWYLPGGAEFNDAVRQAVLAHLETTEVGKAIIAQIFDKVTVE